MKFDSIFTLQNIISYVFLLKLLGIACSCYL